MLSSSYENTVEICDLKKKKKLNQPLSSQELDNFFYFYFFFLRFETSYASFPLYAELLA